MSGHVRVVLLGEADGESIDLDPAASGRPEVELSAAGDARIRSSDAGGGDRTRTASAARLAESVPGQPRFEVVIDGWRFELEVEDSSRAVLRERATRGRDAAGPSAPLEIRAIIPGRVASVRVVAGDEVEAGRTLLVVEAMKMQNEQRAPRAGRVERVVVAEGQTIEVGDLLVVLA
jgi:biotin carboxyl carrier protein